MAVSQSDLELARARRTAVIGLTLAALILTGWISVHIYSVFFFELAWESWPLALLLLALNTWLSVGLFIVAHDCMHGSLVPYRPHINRWIGRVCLFLYAGFSYDTLNVKHHLHHRHAGTHEDPDFNDVPPYGFWQWFLNFFFEYFSWRQYLHMTVQFVLYVLVFGALLGNVLLFWALPAILSAFQLFFFGTWLPHRPGAVPFSDRHRSRSNEYPWIVSLLTCFHFGYHHEHHLEPSAPWWRLPAVRRDLRPGASAGSADRSGDAA